MLTEYEQYILSEGETLVDSQSHSRGDMDAMVGTTTMSPAPSMFRSMDMGYLGQSDADPDPDCRWVGSLDQSADSYTLTVLDASQSPTPDQHYQGYQGYQGSAMTPSWELHGPGHIEDECAVSGSDGVDSSSSDRRCVRSLLHVALQKGGAFAQQYTSCGVPPLQSLPPYSPLPPCSSSESYYLPVPVHHVKQEPMFVSSSSASPRPLTPADSLRSCSPGYPPLLSMAPADEMVSTTTGYHPGYYAPPSAMTPPAYSAFRPTYPTPSPDPAYPQLPPPPQQQQQPLQNTIVPLPVHMLPTMNPVHGTPSAPSAYTQPMTPPSTPTTTSTTAKRRRNRSQANAQGGGASAGAGAGAGAARKRERSERQLHPCTLCDKRFKDNYSVNVHMRTHTGEKPFPCIVCGKMFRQKAHLAKHKSTHQAAEYAAAASRNPAFAQFAEGVGGVDSNANNPRTPCVPLWAAGPAGSGSTAESKCKVSNVWTPSVLSKPQADGVRTAQ